jgi:hypothetical protein
MGRVVKTNVFLGMVVLFAGVCQAGSLGPIQPGIRAGYYDDTEDFFVGADAKFSVLMLSANPSIEYIFVDGGTLMTFNADALFNVLKLPAITGWIGGGVGLMYVSPDEGDSSTDGLFNVIAGAGFSGPLNPYLMAKWVFSDKSDGFAVGAGVRF